MILSKNTEGENIVIFDDPVLQIIMGQWLGILPSSSKKGFLLSGYKEPKSFDEFDSNTISKKKLEKIESEFAKVLKIFNLHDEIYLIKDFDQKKQTFSCNLFHKGERAIVQFDFHRILTFPSSFIVSYRDAQTKYSFVTDPNSHENILVSINKKRLPVIKEFSNLNFYKIEFLEQNNSIEVEYQHQLKSLEKANSIINYDLLYEGFGSLNHSDVTFLDTISFFSQILKKDIRDYRKIRIDWNQKVNDDNHNLVLEILNGQIEKLEIGGHEANSKQRSEVASIFNSMNHDNAKGNHKKR